MKSNYHFLPHLNLREVILKERKRLWMSQDAGKTNYFLPQYKQLYQFLGISPEGDEVL